jgi:hypothetical protein
MKNELLFNNSFFVCARTYIWHMNLWRRPDTGFQMSFSLALYLIFWSDISSWNMNLVISAMWACQWTLGTSCICPASTLPHLPVPNWGYRHLQGSLALCMCWRTQVLTRMQWAFYTLSHYPLPRLFFPVCFLCQLDINWRHLEGGNFNRENAPHKIRL